MSAFVLVCPGEKKTGLRLLAHKVQRRGAGRKRGEERMLNSCQRIAPDAVEAVHAAAGQVVEKEIHVGQVFERIVS